MLRVTTLNVWGWWFPVQGSGRGKALPDAPRPPAWAARTAALRTGLRALQPDLVAFQELIHHDSYDQGPDLLGPGYHLAHQRQRDTGGTGVSIASRWPLVDVREVDLQLTPRTTSADFVPTTIIAEVQAPAPFGPLLFANHNPNWQLAFERERELQSVAAARAIEQRLNGRELHVVVAGTWTPPQRRPACGSGAGYSLWTA